MHKRAPAVVNFYVNVINESVMRKRNEKVIAIVIIRSENIRKFIARAIVNASFIAENRFIAEAVNGSDHVTACK
jgi:hypothetical protein